MKKEYILVSKAKVKKVHRLNIEQFKALLNDLVRNQFIDDYRLESDPETKRLMKLEMHATLPHALDFTDSIRHDESAVPCNIFYTDYDFSDNPHMGDPREYYLKYIAPILDELHAFDVHITVSKKGLHIGAYLPENATIEQAQEWQGKMIGLKPDSKCTNLSRLFIMPKAEDYLHMDLKAMFGEQEVEPYTIDLSEIKELPTETSTIHVSSDVEKLMKNGIPAMDIVATTLAKIVKHPLPLVEGERNDAFLKAGEQLWHLFKDESLLVKLFEPFGLSEAERKQVCKNAAKYASSRNNGTLPLALRKTIQELREEAGLTTTANYLPCRPMPENKNLAPLIREIIAVMPPEWREAAGILMLPILGVLATHIRAKYLDDKLHSTTLWAHVISEQAGGKSTLIGYLSDKLMVTIRQRDELGRQQEREYAEALRKAKNSDKQPEDPRPVIREVPFVISVAALLKRLDQANGDHVISITHEVDTMNKTNSAGAWSQKTDLYRNSFENELCGQDFLSDNSYSGMVKIMLNGLGGGTYKSSVNFYGKHVEDGLVGRVAFVVLPPNEGGKMPIIRQLTSKQEAVIQAGILALESAEGEVCLPRTLKALEKWLDEKYQLSVETMSTSIDIFRKRAASMGYRAAVISYILFGYKEKQAVIDYALWVTDVVLKYQVALWGNQLENSEQVIAATSVPNLYKELPEEFTREELVNLRIINGQGSNVRTILSRWRKEGKIIDIETNLFRKTQA